MPTTQDTDTTVPYGYRLHQVQLSLGGPDTYYQSAQLEPYKKALDVKAMKKYFSTLPAHGGPSLKVERRILENELMDEIKRLE